MLRLAFLVLVFISACTPTAESIQSTTTSTSVLGAWKMTAFSWISADTTHTIQPDQKGLFIFSPSHYSIMWSPTGEQRVPFRTLSQPTEEEMIAGFKSVVFNGGVYEMTDSTIITTAQIAKVPGFKGGRQFYRYQMDGELLTLTMYDETYPDGGKPDWSGTWSTRFVLKKASATSH